MGAVGFSALEPDRLRWNQNRSFCPCLTCFPYADRHPLENALLLARSPDHALLGQYQRPQRCRMQGRSQALSTLQNLFRGKRSLIRKLPLPNLLRGTSGRPIQPGGGGRGYDDNAGILYAGEVVADHLPRSLRIEMLNQTYRKHDVGSSERSEGNR